jgi:hypothetical protein
VIKFLQPAGRVLAAVGPVLAANISALLCLCGLVALYVGVAGFSVALANIVLGVLLIALSVGPYLIAVRKG